MTNSTDDLKNITIVGTPTCRNCHDLKEEIENYYPNVEMRFVYFKDLPSENRDRVRTHLNEKNTTLPVILLNNNEIYAKTYQEYLDEVKSL